MATMRLFTRLLLAQLATALGVALLLFGLFYVDRSITVSRLLAQRWAPAIHAALGDRAAAERIAPPAWLQQDQPPPGAVEMASLAPRYAVLRNTLAGEGLALQRVAVSQDAQGQPTTWLEFRPPGRSVIWLGFVDPLVESRLPGRFMFALLASVALLLGLSWALARHLSRPLDILRRRMQQHRPGDASAPATPVPGASPEVAAIDAECRAMQQRLAQHEQERSLMLAGISHDLRSPLARIRLAAELLPDEPALAARRDSLMRNVQVADRLIEAFLDHARAQQLPLDQVVDLAGIARDLLQARAAPPGQLQAELPAALALPAAHPLLIERLLANLLDNAFQHGRPPVVLRLLAGQGEAIIEVQDAGEGIPEAWRDTALQAFSRGDASRHRPGTGLGLAIVQQTVQRLGGRIEFAAASGQHIVRVHLPLQAPADTPAGMPHDPRPLRI